MNSLRSVYKSKNDLMKAQSLILSIQLSVQRDIYSPKEKLIILAVKDGSCLVLRGVKTKD